MLSEAKHLLFLVETNKADPFASAQDDIVGRFCADSARLKADGVGTVMAGYQPRFPSFRPPRRFGTAFPIHPCRFCHADKSDQWVRLSIAGGFSMRDSNGWNRRVAEEAQGIGPY